MRFLEIIPGERLVYDHGSDLNDDPNRFHVTITFDEQGDGKTDLTLRQFHPSKDRRDATIGFGAVELGYQTLGKLVEYLAGMTWLCIHEKRQATAGQTRFSKHWRIRRAVR